LSADAVPANVRRGPATRSARRASEKRVRDRPAPDPGS